MLAIALTRLWPLAALLLALTTAAAAPLTLYVAPGGNDANAGTAAKPLATLQGARDAVRALQQQALLPAGGVTVLLRPGLYEVPPAIPTSARAWKASASASTSHRAPARSGWTTWSCRKQSR